MIEVKTGSFARLSVNQRVADPSILSQGGVAWPACGRCGTIPELRPYPGVGRLAVALMASGLQLAEATLRGPMAGLGFRAVASGHRFVIPLAPGILGTVGLNNATKGYGPGVTSLYPIIGVRVDTVERTVAEFQGTRLHRYYPATISRPLGAIAGLRFVEDTNWVFGPGNTDGPATALVGTLVRHGLPFMREHITLPAVLDAMDRRWCMSPEYRKPVVLALLGRLPEAYAVLDQITAEVGARGDLAAQQWRRFAAAFRQRDWVPS